MKYPRLKAGKLTKQGEGRSEKNGRRERLQGENQKTEETRVEGVKYIEQYPQFNQVVIEETVLIKRDKKKGGE